MLQLIVTSPFGSYAVGDAITDPALIEATLAGPDLINVVQVDVGAVELETISLGIITANPYQPLALAGEIVGAKPTALQFSIDEGANWGAGGRLHPAGRQLDRNGAGAGAGAGRADRRSRRW